MSAYVQSKTVMTDLSLLVAAINAIGLQPTVSDQPVRVGVYQAHVVIPYLQLRQRGVYTEIGYLKGADGMITAVLDGDFLRGPESNPVKEFLGLVTKHYRVQQAIATGLERGATYNGTVTLPNGDLQAQFIMPEHSQQFQMA